MDQGWISSIREAVVTKDWIELFIVETSKISEAKRVIKLIEVSLDRSCRD